MTVQAFVDSVRSFFVANTNTHVQTYWAEDATTEIRVDTLEEGEYEAMIAEIDTFSTTFKK